MVLVLALLTALYAVVVLWLRRARRAARSQNCPELPAEDRPPPTAVGWPPEGPAFFAYVEEGFEALDAYLSEGFAA